MARRSRRRTRPDRATAGPAPGAPTPRQDRSRARGHHRAAASSWKRRASPRPMARPARQPPALSVAGTARGSSRGRRGGGRTRLAWPRPATTCAGTKKTAFWQPAHSAAREAGVDDYDRPGGHLAARALLHHSHHFVAQGRRPIGDPFTGPQDVEVRAANAGPCHPHQGLTYQGRRELAGAEGERELLVQQERVSASHRSGSSTSLRPPEAARCPPARLPTTCFRPRAGTGGACTDQVTDADGAAASAAVEQRSGHTADPDGRLPVVDRIAQLANGSQLGVQVGPSSHAPNRGHPCRAATPSTAHAGRKVLDKQAALCRRR